MMYEEFQEIAGYEVSYEDYKNIIEPMYTATNLSKQEFVKVIDKKRFALKTEKQLVSEMRKLAEEIMNEVEYTNAYESKAKLVVKVKNFEERFFSDCFWEFNNMQTGIFQDYDSKYMGCSFPVQISFYTKDGKEIYKIDLLPKMIKEFGISYGISKAI